MSMVDQKKKYIYNENLILGIIKLQIFAIFTFKFKFNIFVYYNIYLYFINLNNTLICNFEINILT